MDEGGDWLTPEEASVKVLRTIHSVLLFSVPVYALVGEGLARRTYRPSLALPLTFSGVAAVALLVALLTRSRMVFPAQEILRRRAGDATALAQWRAGCLISLVACESVALCGFALRVVSHPLAQALPFYLVATVLMLSWTPRLDTSSGPR
jgi:hypothetical protein